MWAIQAEDIFGVGMTCVSLLYRSLIITANWLPDLLRVSWARMSILINYSEAPAGKKCR